MKIFKAMLFATVMMVPFSAASSAADLGPDEPSAVSESSLIGLYLRGDIGWSILDMSGGSDDNNYVLGGGIGYQFTDYFRVDLTADMSGDYAIAPGAKISTTAVLGNVYFDWANDSMFTPYVGVGAGWGWIDGSGAAADDDGLALGAAAGVAVDLTTNLAVDMGYRFRNIDISGDDTREHQATVGMRVKF